MIDISHQSIHNNEYNDYTTFHTRKLRLENAISIDTYVKTLTKHYDANNIITRLVNVNNL